jgi:hypothetical protein
MESIDGYLANFTDNPLAKSPNRPNLATCWERYPQISATEPDGIRNRRTLPFGPKPAGHTVLKIT